MVARCTCQNTSGSSSSSSSLSGLRINDSPLRVTTRVYLRSDWKNSTSVTGIRRICAPTEAWIQRSRVASGLPSATASCASTACIDAALATGWPTRALSRSTVSRKRASDAGLST